MAGRYSMNPQHAAHLNGEEAQDVEKKSGQHKAPHIHIHSHAKGHTVHIMHLDGAHEKHEHSHGDAEGIAAHIHQHMGGNAGQDHGVGDGSAGEEEGALI